MKARGETALHEAIKKGVEMTDAAEGPEEAIRGVVVLTDGRANRCETRLDQIIDMESTTEVDISVFTGCEKLAIDVNGNSVEKWDVIGSGLAMDTEHPIQIFYIGIGDDADLDVGRMLAGATGGEFQAASEDDLAQVLAEFAKYF